MAAPQLDDTRGRAEFFRHSLLANLGYWQDWLAASGDRVAALDRQRPGIIKAILFGLDLEPAWPAVRDLIQTFSPYMERRGYWDSWGAVLARALEVAGRQEDATGRASLLVMMARLLRRQGRLAESAAYYRRTLRLTRLSGDGYNRARACTNLGYHYIEHGYWQRAEVLCCRALALFEQLDSDHGRAHTQNHLGLLYLRRGRWEQARAYLEQACARWQAMGDDHGLMYGFLNLGSLFNEKGQPERGRPYLEKARRLAVVSGEEIEVARIDLSLGNGYRLSGRPFLAEVYARRAADRFQRFSNLFNLPLAWNNLAGACLDQGKWAEAADYLQQALDSCREMKHRHGEMLTLGSWVEYELARGEPAAARLRLQAFSDFISRRRIRGQEHRLETLTEMYRRSLAGEAP